MVEDFTDYWGAPLKLTQQLLLAECPHCQTANPNIVGEGGELETNGPKGYSRKWLHYTCQSCGGCIIAAARSSDAYSIVTEIYPRPKSGLSTNIPELSRDFLREARDGVFNPRSCIMVCASAVQAMLAEKKIEATSIYRSLNKAVKEGVLSEDLAKWGHQVRLEANEQRHVDKDKPAPTTEDAERCLEFTMMLAEILFVIPARVSKGLETSQPESNKQSNDEEQA